MAVIEREWAVDVEQRSHAVDGNGRLVVDVVREAAYVNDRAIWTIFLSNNNKNGLL